MRQLETTHSRDTDYTEYTITLVHQVDTDNAWEGVSFHSVGLTNGTMFYSGDEIRAYFTQLIGNRMECGYILDEIEKLVDGTDYRFDTLFDCVEKA